MLLDQPLLLLCQRCVLLLQPHCRRLQSTCAAVILSSLSSTGQSTLYHRLSKVIQTCVGKLP